MGLNQIIYNYGRKEYPHRSVEVQTVHFEADVKGLQVESCTAEFRRLFVEYGQTSHQQKAKDASIDHPLPESPVD